jgi:LytS/YehU family sensor histidine kinase
MLQTYLINILLFCAILLLIAFIVGTVQLIIILIDVRRSVKEVTEKVNAITSLFDIVTVFSGAFGLAKGKLSGRMPGKTTLTAFAAGLKKGLEVLFKK